MPDLPGRLREWVLPPTGDTSQIIRAYESGMAGCVHDPEAAEYVESYGMRDAEQVVTTYGYEDAGKGKLSAPFLAVTRHYKSAFPGPAQRRGSCVAHAARNAALITLCTEAMLGEPDPISGHIETYPEVSPTAEKNGVLAIEPLYRLRKHRGDGWNCADAVNEMVRRTGAVLRKDYGFVDLTKLDPSYAGAAWNASQISDEERNAFDDNLIQDAVTVRSWEEFRDLTAAGFGIVTCGGESWSNKRDENAYSPRTSSGWAHALLGNCVADDRPETHRKYGGPVCGPANSWALWNSGPRRIPGTDWDIPPGSWLARWKDFSRRSMYAIAGLNGWLRTKLPDFNPGW